MPATPGFLEGLRERCDRHGILLVIDEVQSGFGRTGRFWGHEHYDVHPDVLITAKGLASGFPLSAIAAPTELMERAWAGSQGGTYGGNAVACAAAIATLDVIENERLVENAATLGAHLMSALADLRRRYPVIGDVRGKGLMVATEFTSDDEPDVTRAKKVQKAVERRGLLMLTCGPLGNVIRWIPPLIVTREQIDQALGLFEEALAETTKEA